MYVQRSSLVPILWARGQTKTLRKSQIFWKLLETAEGMVCHRRAIFFEAVVLSRDVSVAQMSARPHDTPAALARRAVCAVARWGEKVVIGGGAARRELRTEGGSGFLTSTPFFVSIFAPLEGKR